MIKVMTIFGTRPEAIKMAPLVKELEKRKEIESIVCVTAQHREMLDQVLEVYDIKPDYDLNIMKQGQTLSEITSRVLMGLEDVMKKEKPNIVLVHGDTTTTFAGALAAFYNQVDIGHVEAGLRTWNKYSPFPEEMNRQMVDRMTDLYFAPTEVNKKALLKEDIVENKIHVVGNTVIDALFCLSKEVIENSEKFYEEKGILIDDKLVLITAHRRENHGERIDRIIEAISYLAKKYLDHTFVIPVHPNPNVKNKIHERLGHFDNIHLLTPLDYPYLVYLMKHAKLILTDSGGIQEEAPSFACPTLVMRYETERKEGVEAGVSKLVGADYDKILEEAEKILSSTKELTRLKAQNPYGDGTASVQIEKIVREYFE